MMQKNKKSVKSIQSETAMKSNQKSLIFKIPLAYSKNGKFQILVGILEGFNYKQQQSRTTTTSAAMLHLQVEEDEEICEEENLN